MICVERGVYVSHPYHLSVSYIFTLKFEAPRTYCFDELYFAKKGGLCLFVFWKQDFICVYENMHMYMTSDFVISIIILIQCATEKRLAYTLTYILSKPSVCSCMQTQLPFFTFYTPCNFNCCIVVRWLGLSKRMLSACFMHWFLLLTEFLFWFCVLCIWQ